MRQCCVDGCQYSPMPPSRPPQPRPARLQPPASRLIVCLDQKPSFIALWLFMRRGWTGVCTTTATSIQGCSLAWLWLQECERRSGLAWDLYVRGLTRPTEGLSSWPLSLSAFVSHFSWEDNSVLPKEAFPDVVRSTGLACLALMSHNERLKSAVGYAFA